MKMWKTIILPTVLYRCETLFLTLREVHRLKMSEKSMWRKIFRHKREEVIEEWRKLHTEELYNLYYSPSIIRLIKSRTFIWFRIGTSSRLSVTRKWTFTFHKRQEISWPVKWLLFSQEGLCSTESVCLLVLSLKCPSVMWHVWMNGTIFSHIDFP
jgi:hypothetical protein